MKSLWEVEQENIKAQNRIEIKVKILGRTFHLPKKLRGIHFGCMGINAEKLLKLGGYVRTPQNGWLKRLNKEGRFHAYISSEEIYLHHDAIKGKKHKASGKDCDKEANRLRAFIPVKYKKKGKSIILTRESYLEAMQLLKQKSAS